MVSSSIVKVILLSSCGKLFKDVETMEFHAAKTNHSNFSESTEEKKPLTDAEKAEQMRLLEEKLKQKRKEREEKEKQEELEREKSRVQMGKELAEAKRRLAEQEMKEIAEARRREKIEDRLARERVKAQIEADKAARKAKMAQQDGSALPEAPAPKPVEPVPSPVKKDYKETKLQVWRSLPFLKYPEMSLNWLWLFIISSACLVGKRWYKPSELVSHSQLYDFISN